MNRLGALLSYYDKNRRKLPWREDPTPYHVWLSEIMLQQTRVGAVIGYYQRFLSRFPDIASLAAAEEDAYLKCWEGLGYYSRVRHLHEAAVVIMEEYGGEMPRSITHLRSLPGIGEYTAAAISALAFGDPAIALDGNLLRIYARLTACPAVVTKTSVKNEARAFFEEMLAEPVPARENLPGDFNQALMDLGAGVCIPNGPPRCKQCPFYADCLSRTYGMAENYPIMPPRKERKKEKRTVLLIRYGEYVVLRQREKQGLLAGLYEFPNTEGVLSPGEAADFAKSLGFLALRVEALPSAKHVFTHIEWEMSGYEIRADELDSKAKERWAVKEGMPFLAKTREVQELYAIPAAFAPFTERVKSLSLRS